MNLQVILANIVYDHPQDEHLIRRWSILAKTCLVSTEEVPSQSVEQDTHQYFESIGYLHKTSAYCSYPCFPALQKSHSSCCRFLLRRIRFSSVLATLWLYRSLSSVRLLADFSFATRWYSSSNQPSRWCRWKVPAISSCMNSHKLLTSPIFSYSFWWYCTTMSSYDKHWTLNFVHNRVQILELTSCPGKLCLAVLWRFDNCWAQNSTAL